MNDVMSVIMFNKGDVTDMISVSVSVSVSVSMYDECECEHDCLNLLLTNN